MALTALLLTWPASLSPVLVAFLASSCLVTCDYSIQVEHLTSLKVPVYTADGNPLYKFDSGSVKKISYDANRKLLYIAGGRNIHYADARNPRDLKILGRISLGDLIFHDVKACGDYVFASYTSNNSSGLLIASAYNAATGFPVVKKETLYDSTDPVSLQLTYDCQKVVMAVDGKAFWNGIIFVDPRPALIIVDVPSMMAMEVNRTEAVTVLDFKELDERQEELMKLGVRFPMEGRVGSISEDLDPRDLVIDDIERKVYVTLQTNNAVIEVDLDSANITKVTGLGLKDWRYLSIDVCDDDGIRFQKHPIYSFYQPGSISLARHSGATYLLTANTGAKRDYSHIFFWSEDKTGSEIVQEGLIANSVESELIQTLSNKTLLGSLRFTTFNGFDDAEEKGMTRFITFGGRSFSIRSLPDLDLMYDSGSDVESRVAQKIPDVFNAGVNEGPHIVRYDRDQTSIEKGPEPSSITTGEYGSLTLIFVGLARPGGVLVYSMPLGSTNPRFETLWIGLPDALKSWDELYMEGLLAAIEVSDLMFVAPHESGTDPLLFVVGAKSGTVSVLKVQGRGAVPDFGNGASKLTHRIPRTPVEYPGLKGFGNSGKEDAVCFPAPGTLDATFVTYIKKD